MELKEFIKTSLSDITNAVSELQAELQNGAIVSPSVPDGRSGRIGPNPPEVFAELSDWWDCMDYDDGVMEIPHTFREWAEYFATERSVELYDLLVEAKRK